MATINNNNNNNKKKLIFNTTSIDLSCGKNFLRRQKNKYSTVATHASSSSATSSRYDTASATSFSAINTPPPECYSSISSTNNDNDNDDYCFMIRSVEGLGRVGGESYAVEKDSDDPYLDFRYSMLQMILEKQIYSKEELKELLNVFLQINSPHYRGVIVRAFTDIWNGVFSIRNPTSTGDFVSDD
ncbi:hypothetical protein ACFE04_013931 [Oxalis oulophora]